MRKLYNLLLVEDEEHKTNDLLRRLEVAGFGKPTVATGVRDAVLAVMQRPFDLIVLDMALPTFAKGEVASAGGVAQSMGGIEILRALKSSGAKANLIIVTQYPEILINGEKIRLSALPRLLTARYGQNVLGSILYSFKTPEWEKSFDAALWRLT
ncbi:hypothetical protein [Mesorhizobium sp. M0768]|uniref:hypothetical protein n=1 Tax=unclassified Mesorhizobium TaxID=325217 RepID=UPI003336A731